MQQEERQQLTQNRNQIETVLFKNLRRQKKKSDSFIVLKLN